MIGRIDYILLFRWLVGLGIDADVWHPMVFTHNALPAGWAIRAGASGGDDAGARCMGRSRGGLTTTIHPLVDANGLLNLTEWLAHDGLAPPTCSMRPVPINCC